MTDTRLLTDRPRPAVRLERHLADPPAVVWRALTEREQLRSWFPCEVIVNRGHWEVGAELSFPFPPGLTHRTLTGVVLEVDEPHALAYTWGEDTLRFELSPEADGTRLVLVDELPPDSAARNAAGWEWCLDRLAGLQPAADQRCQLPAAFEPLLGTQQARPTASDGQGGEPA
jgi:uncharacterized protein YndB with AHSA1/START domain